MIDRICALCRQPMRGTGVVSVDGIDYWLCHPDEGQDCYHLATVHKHSLADGTVFSWLR